MSTFNIQNWDLIQTNKTNGTAKLKCPACTDTRKNKQDRSIRTIGNAPGQYRANHEHLWGVGL